MTPLTTLIIPTTLNLFLCMHRRYWMYTCFYISVLYPYFTLLSFFIIIIIIIIIITIITLQL
jgi:hypothetical protein